MVWWWSDFASHGMPWQPWGLLKIGGQLRDANFESNWIYLDIWLKIPWIYLSLSPHLFIFSGLLQEPHGCPGGSTQDLRLGNGWIGVKCPCQQGHDQIPQLRMCPQHRTVSRPVGRSERTVNSQPKSLQSLRDRRRDRLVGQERDSQLPSSWIMITTPCRIMIIRESSNPLI